MKNQICNATVWLVVFAPLLTIGWSTISPDTPDGPLWGMVMCLNVLLCLIDMRLLLKAGKHISRAQACALLLPPVYLYLRAATPNQNYIYVAVWTLCLVLSLYAM